MDPRAKQMLKETDAVLVQLEELRLAGVKQLPDDAATLVENVLARLGRPDRVPKRTKAAIDLVFRLQESWLPQPIHPPRRLAKALPT